MIAVIMAGGSGTRFWPLSRNNNPKQFLKLFNNKSMIRLTYERLLNLVSPEDIFVVTTQAQVALTMEHLPELSITQIIIEPCGMNTAPCIALSSIYLSKLYDIDEICYILPADHYIPDSKLFSETLQQAIEPASQNSLLSFGINPEYPATGYGYIEVDNAAQGNAFHVKQFKEKPDYQTAVKFLKSGNFYWNSGMFCWKLSAIINNFEIHCKDILDVARLVLEEIDIEKQTTIYKTISKLPIDIAIMEKSDSVKVIPAKFQWSDVGNWYSLSNLMEKDTDNNYFQNEGCAINANNVSVFSEKFVSIIGLQDIVLVETPDSILLTTNNQSETVKETVEYLKKCNKTQLL